MVPFVPSKRVYILVIRPSSHFWSQLPLMQSYAIHEGWNLPGVCFTQERRISCTHCQSNLPMCSRLNCLMLSLMYVIHKVLFLFRKSAACTRVSGLLRALVVITPSEFAPPAASDAHLGAAGEKTLPITSYECQWIQPRKWKENNENMADAKFEKHVYGCQRKHTIEFIEDCDSRPP